MAPDEHYQQDPHDPPGPAATAAGGSGAPEPAPEAPNRSDLGLAFARSPVAMAVVDDAGRVLYVNLALARFLGHDGATLVGTTVDDHLAAEERGRLRLGSVGERRLRHGSGHDVWAVVTAVPLPELGSGATLVSFDDATSRRNTERLLLHAALHDSLTNLPNRRLLRDRLDNALARAERTDARVAVLFLDLDRFKDVNDALGHDVGDDVLVAVAGGILAALRAGDTVARFGGDEFVVVCDDVAGEEDLARLVERLLAGIRRPVHTREGDVSVSASIGVAVARGGGLVGDHAQAGEDLLRQADLAMLRAKHRPDLPYVLADGAPFAEPAYLGPALLAELRHAIQVDELALHYQPVVRADGQLVGFEALLRWPHPRLGLLLPEDFLPAVAGSEVAGSLSDWALRAAIRDAASWHDPSVRVSVNVWAAQVAQPGFADTVAMLLTWAGLAGRGLYLELHEHEIATAGPGLASELKRLRLLGVGLAVDDVGPGGPRLAVLDHLPVDTVKVDRSVVAHCVDDPADEAIVAAVALAARAAGRHAVAAGVETPAQLEVLRRLGYESVQGYLAGAPAPLVDLREVISHRRVELPTG